MKTKINPMIYLALGVLLTTASFNRASATIVIPPAHLELYCGQDYNSEIAAWLQQYTVNEFCDVYNVTNDYPGGVISFCTEQFITVTWTAYSNNCTSPATASGYIHVNPDLTPPGIHGPAIFDIDCHTDLNQQVDLWLNSYVVDYNYCLGAYPTVNRYLLDPLPNICTAVDGELIDAIFIATDACGNTAVAGGYMVVHETPPTFTGDYNDVNLGCNPSANHIMIALGTATATDECSEPTITLSDGSVVNNGCNRSKTRTFTATDACGHTSTTTRTVRWIEDPDPVAFSNCTPGIDLGCNPVVPTCANVMAPNIFSTCNITSVTCSESSVSNTSTYGRSKTFTWTAVRSCDNATATCSRTFTWKESPPINVDAGPNKIVYRGYADSSCTLLQSTVSGGVAPLVKTWSTGSHASSINVCPTTTTIYYLTVVDAIGCSMTDSVKVCVIDVRCGNNNKSVIICHGTGSATNPYTTLCVGKTETNSHFLNHPGEQLGPCGLVKTCNWPVQERLEADVIQEGIEYLGAFPNPFSSSTTIRFMLPENDDAVVKVIDVMGREIETLYDGHAEAGTVYDITFDGATHSGGIYLISLHSRNGIVQTNKLILDK